MIRTFSLVASLLLLPHATHAQPKPDQQKAVDAMAAKLVTAGPDAISKWHHATMEQVYKFRNSQDFQSAARLEGQQDAVLKAMNGKPVVWATKVTSILATGQITVQMAYTEYVNGHVRLEFTSEVGKRPTGDDVRVGQPLIIRATIESAQVARQGSTVTIRLKDVSLSADAAPKKK